MLRFFGILVLVVIVAMASIFGGIYLYLSPVEEVPRLQSPSSVRTVSTGEVVGFQGHNDAHTWLGIPYAQPPVGDLRWKAPRPVLPWDSRREMLTYGDPCPQLQVLSGSPQDNGVVGSEDCLTLNIWAPTFGPTTTPSGDDRLPVMVWLHGGGNTMGSGGSEQFAPYDGSLMSTEHEVIVVTVNHRLGPMGWLAHDALMATSESPEDASGNFGTLDLIEALRWIQANIDSFGGNPDNVTIYGESAGGHNVLSLVVSPLARGLFHRGIVQSGGLNIVPMEDAKSFEEKFESPGGERLSTEKMTTRWMIESGLATDANSAKKLAESMSQEEQVDWLRGLSLQEIYGNFDAGFAGMINMPVLLGDGHVLPALDNEAIFSDPRRFADVPLLMGTNRDETALFMAFSPDYVELSGGLPSGIKDPEGYKRDVAYSSDLWRATGVDSIAEAISKFYPEQVFVYRFDADDWRNYGVIDLKTLIGAAHVMEIPFVFGFFPNPSKLVFPDSTFEEVELLSTAMMSYWAEFARSGRPGRGQSGEQESWLPWRDRDSGHFMVLDTDVDAGIRMEQGITLKEQLIDDFVSDESFKSVEFKCSTYRNTFSPPNFDAETYKSLGCI